MRTEPEGLAIDNSRRALALDSFKIVGWNNRNVSTLRLFKYRTCKWMVAVEFQRRRLASAIRLRHGHSLAQRQRRQAYSLRERARFVHRDRFQLCGQLYKHSALDQHTVTGRRRQRQPPH